MSWMCSSSTTMTSNGMFPVTITCKILQIHLKMVGHGSPAKRTKPMSTTTTTTAAAATTMATTGGLVHNFHIVFRIIDNAIDIDNVDIENNAGRCFSRWKMRNVNESTCHSEWVLSVIPFAQWLASVAQMWQTTIGISNVVVDIVNDCGTDATSSLVTLSVLAR